MVKETSPDSCWFHHPHPRKNNSQPTADKECIKTSFFLHVTFCQEAFPAEAPATSDTSSPFDEPLPPQTRLCSLGHLPQPPWAALREAGQPRLQDGQKGAQTPGAAVLDTPLPLDGRASCKPPNRRDPLVLWGQQTWGSKSRSPNYSSRLAAFGCQGLGTQPIPRGRNEGVQASQDHALWTRVSTTPSFPGWWDGALVTMQSQGCRTETSASVLPRGHPFHPG